MIGGPLIQKVAPPPSHKLKFAVNGLEIKPETCNSLVLTLMSQNKKIPIFFESPVSLDREIPLSLSTASKSGKFFRDQACSINIESITIAAKATQTEVFYYRDSGKDSGPNFTIEAAPIPAELKYDQHAEKVGTYAIEAAKLGVSIRLPELVLRLTVTALENLPVGACKPFNLGLHTIYPDSVGTVSNSGPQISARLASDSASGSFYQDAACSQQTITIEIPQGQSQSADVYYRDFSPGAREIEIEAIAPFGLKNYSDGRFTVVP
jgi:hypothetical protein